MNGGPIALYIWSPRLEVAMGDHKIKHTIKLHGILHLHKYIMSGGHIDLAARELK